MAEIVSIQGVNHNPWFWRAFQEPDPDDAMRRLMGRFDEYAAAIRAADADAVVVIGTDHLNQLAPDNMPSFLVCKQPHIRGTFWNETREFGIPTFELEGDPALAADILAGGLHRHFDLGFSHDLRLDHSFMIPLHYLTESLQIPVVPILTNCIAPPLPQARRFYEMGEMLRDTIESSSLARRVAVVSSGHVSLEIGGPRMFGGQTTPSFDDQVTALIGDGAIDELVEVSSFENLSRVGNVSHQFMNFIATAGVAGGRPASAAEIVLSRFTSPFYTWEP